MRKTFKTTRKALATAVMAGLLSCEHLVPTVLLKLLIFWLGEAA